MRDLRRYARNTTLRLAFGFLILILIVGDGLIFWLYGPEAAVSGLLCIGAGLFPLILIGLGLFILDLIVKRANDE